MCKYCVVVKIEGGCEQGGGKNVRPEKEEWQKI